MPLVSLSIEITIHGQDLRIGMGCDKKKNQRENNRFCLHDPSKTKLMGKMKLYESILSGSGILG